MGRFAVAGHRVEPADPPGSPVLVDLLEPACSAWAAGLSDHGSLLRRWCTTEQAFNAEVLVNVRPVDAKVIP